MNNVQNEVLLGKIKGTMMYGVPGLKYYGKPEDNQASDPIRECAKISLFQSMTVNHLTQILTQGFDF